MNDLLISEIGKTMLIELTYEGYRYENSNTAASITDSGEIYAGMKISENVDSRNYPVTINYGNQTYSKNIDVQEFPPRISLKTLVNMYFLIALPGLGLPIILSTFVIEQYLILKIQKIPKKTSNKTNRKLDEWN